LDAIRQFNYHANQVLYFGAGRFTELPRLIDEIGNNVLLVHGASIMDNPKWDHFLDALAKLSIRTHELISEGEPSPEAVDEAAEEYRRKSVHAVIAVGGGSAVDLGKAVSAMIPQKGSVTDFLEGVGKKKHDGYKVPFIAVPTTAGTGSEATKNAVISRLGKKGYKKSLRQDNLIPDIALVDPELTLSCPHEVTAASGLDGLTQLIESYVSVKATPVTDALVLSALEGYTRAFEGVLADSGDIGARTWMSYMAYCSGAALANSGLGTIHSLAGELGALKPVPHGVLCGTLLAAGHRANIEAMEKNPSKYETALAKYSRVGNLLAGKDCGLDGCGVLTGMLDKWVGELGLPKLGEAGYTRQEMEEAASRAENKNNPVELDSAARVKILMERY